jgi:hypothetical protein
MLKALTIIVLAGISVLALFGIAKSAEVDVDQAMSNEVVWINMNPSFSQVADFIEKDKTNEKEYVKDEYTCVDFSNELIKNAAQNGIFGCQVYVSYDDGMSHSLVAFNTHDRGVVYVNPQFDEIVDIDSYMEEENVLWISGCFEKIIKE